MDYIIRTKSILTGKKNLEHLYTLNNFPVFMGCVDAPEQKDLKFDMSFSICKNTGIIQLDKLLPLDAIYQGQHNDGVGAVWQRHYSAFSGFLEKFASKRILEIGGAKGIIAEDFIGRNPNAKWTIVEPNPIYGGNEKIRIIKDWFDEKFVLDEKIDAIVHSHVLEHIYEPLKFINHIAQFLQKGDKHIFTCPNMVEQLNRKYTNCLNFEHTLFLAEPFVDAILSRAGFKIITKDYFEDHSIFYAAEKTGEIGNAPFPNKYGEYKKLFLDFIGYHKNLIEDLNKATSEFGGEAYLFGAHIFSQYLLGFGLDGSKIKAILDNSKIKQGKRLYGTPFVVCGPEILGNLNKAAVILKVGAYRDEILNQIHKINPKVIIFE